MKILETNKDGGPESNVTGYWLIEWKALFSVALLRFDNGSREAFHSHAFNCVSWLLKGELLEKRLCGVINLYRPSFKPIITRRSNLHQVVSFGTSWVITFRGPWAKTWNEFKNGKLTTLTNGRKVVRPESMFSSSPPCP